MDKIVDLYLEARSQANYYGVVEKLAILYGTFHGLKFAEALGEKIFNVQPYDLAKRTYMGLEHWNILPDDFGKAVARYLEENGASAEGLDFSVLEKCDRTVAGHYARAFGTAFDVVHKTSNYFAQDLEFYFHWLKVRQSEILTLLAPLTGSDPLSPRRARK